MPPPAAAAERPPSRFGLRALLARCDDAVCHVGGFAPLAWVRAKLRRRPLARVRLPEPHQLVLVSATVTSGVRKFARGAMELVALDIKRRGMYISRQLSFKDANHKTIWLGMIRTSVYTQGQKGETKEGVDQIKPGDRVEMTGVFRAVPVRESARTRVLKSTFRTYVDVVHVRKTDSSRLAEEGEEN